MKLKLAHYNELEQKRNLNEATQNRTGMMKVKMRKWHRPITDRNSHHYHQVTNVS